MAVFVFIEHREGKLMDISFEALSAAQKLNDEVIAVLSGENVSDLAEKVVKYADKVIIVEDPKIDTNNEAYTRVLDELVKKEMPKIVIMGHTSMGMDIAPAVAIDLGLPIATDVVNISKDGNIKVTRSIYNGKVLADYYLKDAETYIITIRTGEFSAEELSEKNGKIERVDSPLKEEITNKKFVGFVQPEVGGVDITQADILVSVGRGIKDKENIPLVEELAKIMGGVLSCSRPIVDYGWLPKERQVGTSGKTVKPKLYLALGISGAFQHVAGMKGANMIVAVNKDPKAPIFSVAQYGIVDDVLKVIPALTQKIKEIKG
ncbi:electron transfer flavoprotein subunit alpha/FixB family protein [Candidatus Methanoliparum sp. LAM-1]|uniref:electron transfer flavoprotein subunit alpha/FixB family protein n=1 Tax=Candidatus Methanoliparum sp. LAM-1 TaxID=2874846 RepID=UPI001E39D6DD|nr:electron transfer flavoprotein subunit alpha/FixB family protein [Candidatus Methanoliparum sp. LAM-1]BDC35714.1 electron transfer flavoprotein subunit alpha [Candidatus Methanoliparum sp. LAM-1]